MLVLLLILLVTTLSLVLIAGIVVWLADSDQGVAESRRELTWRPPLARGEELLDWTRATTAQVVRKFLLKGPTTTSVELIGEVHQGANQAMLPMVPVEEIQRVIACPENGQRSIGVTALEAIEIADYVRQNLSRRERNRIHDLALANTRKLAHGDATDYSSDPTPCPLQGNDRICRVYASRPLHCRPLHAARIANQLGLETSGAEGRIPPWAAHMQTVEQGIAEGLAGELESAGLDGHEYELNSALVTALDTPDAAERWAHGEDVFAACARCH